MDEQDVQAPLEYREPLTRTRELPEEESDERVLPPAHDVEPGGARDDNGAAGAHVGYPRVTAHEHH